MCDSRVFSPRASGGVTRFALKFIIKRTERNLEIVLYVDASSKGASAALGFG